MSDTPLPPPAELHRVTPEMQQAYIDWEPPFEGLPNTAPRIMTALRAAYFGGWTAALTTHSITAMCEALTRLVKLDEWLNGEPSCVEEIMNYVQHVARAALSHKKENGQ
jgi:hypothetical protein